MTEVTALLYSVIGKSQSAMDKLVQSRILVGTEEPEREMQPDGTYKSKRRSLDDKPFFDMLLTHRNQDVRELAEQILSNVMTTLFATLESGRVSQEEGDRIYQVVQTITQTMIQLIPVEAQRFWHKLGAFFSFFHNMVKDGNRMRVRHFMQVGLVQKLIELVGKWNPTYEFSAPPFDKLVATICVLARCQPMIVYLHGIKDQFQPDEAEVKGEIDRWGEVSPYCLLRDSLDPQNIADQEIITLPVEDIRALVQLDRKTKEFYNQLIKNTQEAPAIAQLMGHLCWRNYETSRRFGKIILKGLNNVGVMELRPYVELMIVFLSIQDQY